VTPVARFMISAAHKSSGKTVVSSGLAAALAARGHDVAAFKKGPDYIDPMWLRLASGHPAYNLDFNTMDTAEIRSLFAEKSAGHSVSLIEANKGLFDGVAADGSDSNAALARLLATPVILVVDTGGMTRGIAPLLQGYLGFDPAVEIAGVILNKTAGARHESKLRQAVETYTGLRVLGAVAASPDMDISERHLGLTTPAETKGPGDFLDHAAVRIEQSVDVDAVLEISQNAGAFPLTPARPAATRGPHLRIGIARDAAFGFYYADDLEAFEAQGGELVPVDMLNDPVLPQIDGLFIGGGFPETQMDALADNATMRDSVRTALENGLPAYAECGGLMYLCRSLTWQGKTRPMAGFFDADTLVHDRPQGRGYVRFSPGPDALWPGGEKTMHAHEFHYASLEKVSNAAFARRVRRGHGIDGLNDALVKNNTTAGFIHLRHTAATPWVSDFLHFVAQCRATKNPAQIARGSA